jgi:hypothetical protein
LQALILFFSYTIYRLNPETGLHYTSKSIFKESDLNFLGKLSLGVLETFHLIDVTRDVGEDKEFIEINNLTLINFVLRLAGPTNEKILTIYILVIQVLKFLFLLFDINKHATQIYRVFWPEASTNISLIKVVLCHVGWWQGLIKITQPANRRLQH